jgi:hypothetical protein
VAAFRLRLCRYSKHTVNELEHREGNHMLALARPQNATKRSEEGHPLQTPSTQRKHVLIGMCINTYERCTLSPWTHESELSPVPKKQSSRRRIRQLGNAAMMRWRPEPSYNYRLTVYWPCLKTGLSQIRLERCSLISQTAARRLPASAGAWRYQYSNCQ